MAQEAPLNKFDIELKLRQISDRMEILAHELDSDTAKTILEWSTELYQLAEDTNEMAEDTNRTYTAKIKDLLDDEDALLAEQDSVLQLIFSSALPNSAIYAKLEEEVGKEELKYLSGN